MYLYTIHFYLCEYPYSFFFNPMGFSLADPTELVEELVECMMEGVYGPSMLGFAWSSSSSHGPPSGGPGGVGGGIGSTCGIRIVVASIM